MCVIKRIEIAKQLFVVDIEQGTEVFIPPDLRISQYPLSMQFNDPILMIIHRRMSDDRKEYFIKKNEILEEFKMANFIYRFKKMFESGNHNTLDLNKKL